MTERKLHPGGRRYQIHCPVCHKPAVVRSSLALTESYRHMHLACTEPACGHVFGASVETKITLTGPIAKRKPLRTPPPRPANDTSGPEVPRPANDDDVLGEAFG